MTCDKLIIPERRLGVAVTASGTLEGEASAARLEATVGAGHKLQQRLTNVQLHSPHLLLSHYDSVQFMLQKKSGYTDPWLEALPPPEPPE